MEEMTRIITSNDWHEVYRAEPLYCPNCGAEIGVDDQCNWDWETDPVPADPYCEMCGSKLRECGCY